MSNRVEIPTYTDRWMMGDRYGVIVGRDDIASTNTGKTVVRVLLDKSGKTIKVVENDCKDI